MTEHQMFSKLCTCLPIHSELVALICEYLVTIFVSKTPESKDLICNHHKIDKSLTFRRISNTADCFVVKWTDRHSGDFHLAFKERDDALVLEVVRCEDAF